MRLAIAAVALLLLTGAAHAAEWNSMWRQEKYCPPGRKVPYCDPERVQKQRQIDDAYQKTIKSQKVQAPASNDPWGGLRASEQGTRASGQ
jgi:hypothetical protein